MASIAASVVPKAVIMITTVPGEIFFTFLSTSKPSAPGIFISVMTRSKISLSICEIPSSPSEAEVTS